MCVSGNPNYWKLYVQFHNGYLFMVFSYPVNIMLTFLHLTCLKDKPKR